MKTLGIILIVIAVILMGASLFSLVHQSSNEKPAVLEAQAENGQTMAILPLLSIISLATGGALVVAAYVTRKP